MADTIITGLAVAVGALIGGGLAILSERLRQQHADATRWQDDRRRVYVSFHTQVVGVAELSSQVTEVLRPPGDARWDQIDDPWDQLDVAELSSSVGALANALHDLRLVAGELRLLAGVTVYPIAMATEAIARAQGHICQGILVIVDGYGELADHIDGATAEPAPQTFTKIVEVQGSLSGSELWEDLITSFVLAAREELGVPSDEISKMHDELKKERSRETSQPSPLSE